MKERTLRANLFDSLYKLKPRGDSWRERLEHFVHGPVDLILGVVLLFNACCVIAEQQYIGQEIADSLTREEVYDYERALAELARLLWPRKYRLICIMHINDD